MPQLTWIRSALGMASPHSGNSLPSLTGNKRETDTPACIADAMEYAAGRGDLGMVKLLFARWAAVAPGQDLAAKLASHRGGLFPPLESATATAKTEVMRFLLSQGVSITDSVVQAAQRSGSPKAFQVLLDHGWDLKREGPKILCNVTKHDSLVQWLLKNGVNPDSVSELGYTALEYAAFNGPLKSVQLLLEYGADIRFSEALVCAAQSYKLAEPDCLDIMIYLLDSGFNIDYVERPFYKPGRWKSKSFAGTALHRAVQSGKFQRVQLLLNKGANRNIRGLEGLTPLELAEREKMDGMVEILSRFGGLRWCSSKNQSVLWGWESNFT